MASTSNCQNTTMSQQPPPPPPYAADSASTNTTFVQADPSTFRAIVQKLTGAPDDPSTPKLPVTYLTRPTAATTTATSSNTVLGQKRPAFKLHERRQTAKKLEIKLNNNSINDNNNNNVYSNGHELCLYKQRGGSFLVSPVSTLEFLARVSPGSPHEDQYYARGGSKEQLLCEDEEERAIAEKGFYLHPSPLSTPRGAEPELLPLFPLTSPRNNNINNDADN